MSQDLCVLSSPVTLFAEYMLTNVFFSVWEAHRCKALTARCHEMSKDVDRVVNEANAHLVDAQNKIQSKYPLTHSCHMSRRLLMLFSDMATEQDELRKRNEELSQAYKEKSRKLLNTQELYDKLKRRLMLGQIQEAASDAVEATINGGQIPMNFANDHTEPQGPFEQHLGTPLARPRYNDRLDQSTGMPAHPRMGPPDIRPNTWARPIYTRGLNVSLDY